MVFHSVVYEYLDGLTLKPEKGKGLSELEGILGLPAIAWLPVAGHIDH